MYKTIRKIGTPTSREYIRLSFPPALSRTRRFPRVSTISSTARADLSHLSSRCNSLPAVAPEPSASVEGELPDPSSQDPDTQGAPPTVPTQQSSPSPSKPPHNSNFAVPKPIDKIALPWKSSTESAPGNPNRRRTWMSGAGRKDPLSLKDESHTTPRSNISFNEEVGHFRRSKWAKFNLDERPKSQFELDLRYNQDLQVLPHQLRPIEPPMHLFEHITDNKTRELEYMYMAINASIKIVQKTIKYEFKNPTILWGALQHYNFIGPEFFPYSTRTGGNAGLAQVGSSLLNLAMAVEGYGKMVPTDVVVAAKGAELSDDRLAQLAIQRDLHRHIYRYKVDRLLRKEVISRAFAAIIGAVWFDSGENMTQVYKCMSTMGLEWPKSLFHSW